MNDRNIVQANPNSGNFQCDCLIVRKCLTMNEHTVANFLGEAKFVDLKSPNIEVDTITEYTANHGVNIEGVLLKDGSVGPAGVNAGSIYNIPVSSTPPTNGQVLAYNLGLNQWVPGPGGGGDGPLPFDTQMVYVRKGGNDITGNGTIIAPYATITYAMSTITDALWQKRYLIDVGPGNWSDSFAWKAWVFMRGSTVQSTRLTGTITINDPSWAFPGTNFDQRAGVQSVSFTGTVTLDFNSVSSQYGKFYFWGCNMNNTLVINGFNPINQCIVEDGFWFGGITATGVAITWNGVSGQGGTINLSSSPISCSFTAFGGGTVGNLSITTTGGIAPVSTLIDCPILGNLSLNGAGSQVSATVSSLPLNSQVSNVGGTIVLLSDAYSLAYNPAVPANWNNNNPTTVQNALDRIAAQIGPIL